MAITVYCTCGKTLKIDEKHRGKKAKCPACGETVLVEESEPETAVTDKPRQRAAARGDEDDDEDSGVRKPLKREPAKSNMMMYALGGGCAFLLLSTCCLTGIGVGVWYFFFSGPPADLIYVHEGVAGFVSIRVGEAWTSPAAQDLLKKIPNKAEFDKKLADEEALAGLKIEDIERITVIIRSLDFNAGKPDVAAVIKSRKPMDRKKTIKLANDKGMKEKEVKHDGATIYVFEGNGTTAALFFHSDYIVVFAETEATLKDILKQSKKPPKSEALKRGVQMASSGKHHLVVAFDVSQKLKDKGGPGVWDKTPNLKDMTGVIFAGTFTKDFDMELVLTFPSSDKAEKGKKDVDKAKGALEGLMLFGGKQPPAFTRFMDSITIEQRGAEVVAKAKAELDFDGFGKMPGGLPFGGFGLGENPGAGPGPGVGQRLTSANNLKQIGLAMHNFHDANKRLPKTSETRVNPNAAGLSWRVAILPYLEQEALYNQIRHDEPFDSQHNRQLWNKMPAVYQLPGKFNDGQTYYQVFRGNESAFPADRNTSIRMADIADGTANTIFVAEAAVSFNWMQPEDILFQKNDAFLMSRVGNHWGDNSFQALMGDSTVMRFSRNMPAQTLQALVTRAGRENVNIQALLAK